MVWPTISILSHDISLLPCSMHLYSKHLHKHKNIVPVFMNRGSCHAVVNNILSEASFVDSRYVLAPFKLNFPILYGQ